MKKSGSEKTYEIKGIFYWRTNLCAAFTNLTYTTNLLVITNDFTDTLNKGKINKNICCSFDEFVILIKVFTDAKRWT